jgi:hypothetical protein
MDIEPARRNHIRVEPVGAVGRTWQAVPIPHALKDQHVGPAGIRGRCPCEDLDARNAIRPHLYAAEPSRACESCRKERSSTLTSTIV